MFSSNTSQVSSGGYEIQRSLRFNSADSAYLNRTPASAGNRRTFTWSAWVKRGKLGDWGYLFQGSAGNPTGGLDDGTAIRFNSVGDGITFYNLINSANDVELSTTQVFRDPSAWYHFVAAVDTTQATASNRVKLYVNGSQITAFNTAIYPAQNADLFVNTTNSHLIGALSRDGGGPQLYYDGYQTEVNFIDGQALTPSSFGAFDAQTGVWGPTRYAGSYGTNGFYLNFSDNSNTTAATLGRDYSGNSNNWTPNNFSVSAGAGNDSLVDVPTNWGVDTGVGGAVRGNYCTLNPLRTSDAPTNGNLDVSFPTASRQIGSTIALPPSGKWYFEATLTALSGQSAQVGVSGLNYSTTNYPGQEADSYVYSSGGQKANSNSFVSYGATYAVNDVIGVAADVDAGTLTFYKNGVSQGAAYTGISLVDKYFVVGMGGISISFTANFGQRPFAYTAPSGFRALNTQNLPTPTIGATTATQAGKFFNPVLYTGNGSTNAVTGVGFQPDLVWIKQRSQARNHNLYDAVRGVLKVLQANVTDVEVNYSNSLTSFDSDGFSLGNASDPNTNAGTYVAWNWRANGAGVTNTAGSVTTTVSANTTSGFSIARGTLPSGVGASYGHGLGVAPSFIIAKSTSSTSDWFVYHSSLGFNQDIRLNSAAAVASSTFTYNSANASTVTIGGGNVNAFWGANTTWVWYSFAEVPGYSRFGSYTGNGSTDGPFVFCGFRPAWVLVKRQNGADDWHLFDNRREGFNALNDPLYPNGSFAEGSGFTYMDLVSNGFKCRNNSFINASGVPYIFMALAEAPQKFALAR